MSDRFYQNYKIGILGGGQLGRMLAQYGIDLDLSFAFLDPDPDAPCSSIGDFTCGRLTDYSTVLDFGEQCELVTIEIESVNTAALKELVRRGKKVYPQPEVIELIQDKRIQKQFYKDNGIPTADFILVENANEVRNNLSFLPAVNKLGRDGYDGKGVRILSTEDDLQKAFNAPGILEKLIDFDKEIAVIVARNRSGSVCSYPAVEMIFHADANLVDYLLAPATIESGIAFQADAIARQVIEKLEMVGLLAVEMFVTRTGGILVNEIAPRPHNSGHQTIEANVTSQYEQHLRAILGLPFGDTTAVCKSAMVNVLGGEGFTGTAIFDGIEKVMDVPGAHIHLYGKKKTKPFRKMGHVTIVDPDIDSLKKKVNFVRANLKVIA